MGMINPARRARIAVLVAIVVGLAVAAAVAAQPAAAYSQYQHGGAACVNCHPISTLTPPTNAQCTACHSGGFTAVKSNTCWTCHTPGKNMAPVQTASGCAAGVSGVGCHANPAPHVGSTLNGGCTSCHSVATSATNPSNSAHHVVGFTVKPALSLAVSAKKIKRGKTVTAKGIMHRVVTGGTVTILVQRKKGSTWKKVTAKVVTSTALQTYRWKYKPAKKGSYRMQAGVPASGKILAGKTVFKTFTVK